MESKIYQTNPINTVFGDSNLLLSILSFLYEKTDRPYEFLTNTPVLLHVLSFKSLYYEIHKIPNLQIQSYPSHYISSLSVFQWAIAMGYSGNILFRETLFDETLFELIVDKHKSQAIHFIDYVMTNTLCYCCYDMAYYATKYGHIHLLEKIKLDDPTFEWDDEIYIEIAASGGHLHVIQWLRNQDPPCSWSQRTCVAATQSGHLHVLQWVRAQYPPCDWSQHACMTAAQSGHLHILQWLRAQDPPCDWSQYVCMAAAKSGHLHILQWLLAQKPPCPCDEMAGNVAAWGGHLHILQWLHEQDPPCKLNINECIGYVTPNNSHILEWLEAQT
jgi:hypothetical protein